MAQSTEILPNGLQLLQDDRFFKLGQDSVLLSAFAKPRRNAKLLDLGCGTGALALLVWRPDLKITGLELQDGPLDLFRQSIAANKLENVTALQGDLRQMRTLLPHGSMDYVICNPPYGERLLDVKTAEDIYKTMGRVFTPKRGWSYAAISPDERFETCFGKKADRRRKLYNGMIKCDAFMYGR